MVAGQGTPDQAPARMMAYRHADAFAKIIDALVENSIQYLLGQLKAGADVLQIFDTWAGVLRARIRALVDRTDPSHRRGVRRKLPGAKIIASQRRRRATASLCRRDRRRAVSIDWAAEPSLIASRCRTRRGSGQSRSAGADRRRYRTGSRHRDVLANYAGGRLIFTWPRHPTGNPDRTCRADGAAGAGV